MWSEGEVRLFHLHGNGGYLTSSRANPRILQGKGSTFAVELPMRRMQPQAVGNSQASARLTRAGQNVFLSRMKSSRKSHISRMGSAGRLQSSGGEGKRSSSHRPPLAGPTRAVAADGVEDTSVGGAAGEAVAGEVVATEARPPALAGLQRPAPGGEPGDVENQLDVTPVSVTPTMRAPSSMSAERRSKRKAFPSGSGRTAGATYRVLLVDDSVMTLKVPPHTPPPGPLPH